MNSMFIFYLSLLSSLILCTSTANLQFNLKVKRETYPGIEDEERADQEGSGFQKSTTVKRVTVTNPTTVAPPPPPPTQKHSIEPATVGGIIAACAVLLVILIFAMIYFIIRKSKSAKKSKQLKLQNVVQEEGELMIGKSFA